MEGELELLRVNLLGIRKWRPQHAVLKGSTLHLSQARGTPDLKTLPLAGAAVAYKDISRPADAWRNLFTLILPPLADRSRGVKKYTFSATSAELQAEWVGSFTSASQSPAEREIAAYSKARRLSKSLSRLAAAAFRPLQLGISALSPSERRASQEPAQTDQHPAGTDGVQCWALPTATSTQQFTMPLEQGDAAQARAANGAAVATVDSNGEVEPLNADAEGTARIDCNAAASPESGSHGGSKPAVRSVKEADAADISKVTYAQLPPHEVQNSGGKAVDQSQLSATTCVEQHPNTTQLIEQRMKDWDGVDESLPTQPAVKA